MNTPRLLPSDRIASFRCWAIAGLSLLAVSDAVATHAAERPNIILCMADDQGWGDVGYNGHKILKTPVLDSMAATALRFDRFYAAAPVCSPTRGSVLTGRHPNRFGCFRWGYTLRPQEVTIAEVLQSAGYATGHFGKWHLGSCRADSPVCPGASGFDHWVSSPNFFDNSPLLSHNGKVIETEGESSVVTVEAALDFIRGAARDKQPFLAVVWFGSPHSPHVADSQELERYKGLPKREQNYYGEISGIDRSMGLLRAELRKLQIADNTLLWYTSDNGAQGPGSTGGLRGKKGSLWEGGIRVPNIIEWPLRIKAPRVTALPSGTVDIFPTLLEVAGVTSPQPSRPLDGQSLLPLIDGKMTRRSKPLGFWVYPANGRPVRSRQLLAEIAKLQAAGQPLPQPNPDVDAGKITKTFSTTDLPGHAAWVDGDYKLHRIPGKAGAIEFSLFNLKSDPAETTNLADAATGEVAKKLARMKSALAAWQASVINSLNGKDD